MTSSRGTTAPAIRMWSRSEIARRWKSLVTLGLIAGVAGGLALAAVAGERRTSSAYERFRAATNAPDAIVFGTQLGLVEVNYGPVLALPEVLDGGLFSLSPVAVKEFEMGSLPPADDHLYRTLSRPLLVHGRLPDPRRADEIVVNRQAAARFHLHVGQQVTLISASDLNAFFGQAPMTGGPTVPARIVGIGDSMVDMVFSPNDPGFVPTGAFLANAPQVPRATNLIVRLRAGTSINDFHEHVAAALHLPDVPVRGLAEDRKRITHATDVEGTALLLFALAVVLAGIVMVGQALSRAVYGMAEPTAALKAMGFTRSGLIAGLVAPMTITALTAAVAAVASAILISNRFPVGLARTLDPHVGHHADWLIIAPGAGLLVALIMLGSLYAAGRAARAARTANAESQGPLVRRIRASAPLPVGIGAGLALGSGRGSRALPVRPAMAGAVAGVLGVVGALGLVHGIDDALARPERSGQVWDAVVWPSQNLSPPALVTALRDDRDVASVMDMVRVPLDIDGAGLPVYSLDAVRGDAPFVVLRGRAPRTVDEVAIGPATAKALHKRVGDRIRISGRASADLTVVGTVLLPQTPHSSFDQGAWVVRDRLATLTDLQDPNLEEVYPVTARRGLKPGALIERLHSRTGNEVDPIAQPQDVLVLRDVRSLPRALAAFLALLGVAAVAHALATAVRRRRHDLAILRAVGFRPRQNAAVIAWQATTVAIVGLLVGLPLGILSGRLSWRWVADSTPLRYVPPVAAFAVVAAIPFAILLANALAVWPSRSAARVRPAEVLRTE